jgi:hypothetical protein
MADDTVQQDPNDLSPQQIEYARNKIAGITDLSRLQQLRENEVNYLPVPGGRKSALAVIDARIAELSTKQEG